MGLLDKLNKPKIAEVIPDTVTKASIDEGPVPGTYHVAALRERRLLIALRSVSIGLIVALILNVVLSLVLFSLMPLKEVRPFLVRVSDESTVVATIQPIQDTFEAKDILTEQLVREYVLNRQEILRSNDAMIQRWGAGGLVQMMSSPDEYNRFVQSVTNILEAVRSEDAERRATIVSVVPIVLGRSYVVDYRLTLYDRNNEIIEDKLYTATMEIAFVPLEGLTREQMLLNPTGFQVYSLSIAEKTQ